MLTLIQIGAILQLLLAFNVPIPTVNTVEAILMAPHATTTIVAPIIITPSKEEAPITPIFQFSGIVEPAPITPEPVVPAPAPVIPQLPKLSSVVLGFYNPPGADVVINYLEFTSDQDIVCHSGLLAGGVVAGTTTKHCVIEGKDAGAKIRVHISECNTTWDKSFYIFSTNQQVDPTKVYSCNITAQGINGTSVNYKHTFSVPN